MHTGSSEVVLQIFCWVRMQNHGSDALYIWHKCRVWFASIDQGATMLPKANKLCIQFSWFNLPKLCKSAGLLFICSLLCLSIQSNIHQLIHSSNIIYNVAAIKQKPHLQFWECTSHQITVNDWQSTLSCCKQRFDAIHATNLTTHDCCHPLTRCLWWALYLVVINVRDALTLLHCDSSCKHSIKLLQFQVEGCQNRKIWN